jgi:acetyl esterase/lipase
MLDPEKYMEYLYPQCLELEPTSYSPLSYHGPDAPIPGFPANPRMLLNRLYLQLGTYLDYYTGEHDPSLSSSLRSILNDKGQEHDFDTLKSLIPAQHHPLFPQFDVNPSAWPPVFFVHGSADSAVWMQETVNMQKRLHDAGVTTIVRIIEGAEHSLDYVPNAGEIYGTPGGLFDEICNFLTGYLRLA